MQRENLENPPLVTGLLREEDSADDGLWLREQCRENVAQGFGFTLLRLTKRLGDLPQGAGVAGYQALPPAPFSRQAHSALNSRQWGNVIGVVDWPRDDDPVLAEFVCNEAVQWAAYLGLHALLFPLRQEPGAADGQAGILADVLNRTQNERFDIWIRTGWRDADWNAWNALRQAIGVLPGGRLHVALDFSGMTEEQANWNVHFDRWFGESLRTVILPTSLFQDGGNGTVLPPRLQALVEALFRYPQITWTVEGPRPQGTSWHACRDHLDAIRGRHTPDWEEVHFRPSVDQRQRPLQPLYDHLGSISYEEFEQDPVKYLQYERAIRQALVERHGGSESVTLMVLGAGRGPIVDAAVRAARDFPGRVRFFVIEKNPSAAVTLRHRARDDWGDVDLTVVETDMRKWQTDERADIIVSELLGSWSDNELSPECLDGAQRLLRDGGISIPASYCSWLSPIASARLHSAVASRVARDYAHLGSRKPLETTWVVRMGAVFQLAAEQPCFEFHHPAAQPADNRRFARCVFEMPAELERCVVHGFRGTFECRLYGEHRISIADRSFCKGMFSWAPLYIPLEDPLTLRGGDPLEVLLWRKVGPHSVWYEWMVKGRSHIHNSSGRSDTIGV